MQCFVSVLVFLCDAKSKPYVFQSGETEPLDLGLPISNLDGLRVVLESSEPSTSNGMNLSTPACTLIHIHSDAVVIQGSLAEYVSVSGVCVLQVVGGRTQAHFCTHI